MRPTLPWAVPWVVALLLGGCADPAPDRERILLVTTTSVEGSGLLDELLEAYHASQDRFRAAATAVGSGAALQLGGRGDADVLLTHDPAGERRFLREGLAAEQGPVMMNRFLIATPPQDPADAAGASDAVEVFRRIAASGALFVSRGDDSGTHAREREIWGAAGLAPWEARPAWYVEAGTGMGETLQMASQLGAYTLADRGTFLHLRRSLELRDLPVSGPHMENRYAYTIPADPPNPEGARDFVGWLRGPGQEVIAGYGRREYGEPLFQPTAARDTAA